VRAFFGETEHRIPGERFRGKTTEKLKTVITEETARDLYQIENAMDAIQQVFTADAYAAINERLGQIRNEANLGIWAEMVSDSISRLN